MDDNVCNCVCVNVSVNKISHNPVDIFVIKLAESIGCAPIHFLESSQF